VPTIFFFPFYHFQASQFWPSASQAKLRPNYYCTEPGCCWKIASRI
jgi:hypothetical protein